MKKIFAALIMSIAATGILSAGFIAVPSTKENEAFKSPAYMIRMDDDVTIGWGGRTGADFSAVDFLIDPVTSLQPAALHMADELARIDSIDFWLEQSGIAGVLSSIDPKNFPSTNNGQYSLEQIKNYMQGIFLSDEYGDVNRAHAVKEISAIAPFLFPYGSHELLGGNLEAATGIYGRHVHDGFGWDWNVDMGYKGQDSYLSSGLSDISVKASMTAGYAFRMFSDNFTLGIAAEPMLIFDVPHRGPAFIASRMASDPVMLFSEPLKFGTGIDITFGMMFEPFDGLAFTMDFRNMPSFKSYFELPIDTIAAGRFELERNGNVYYEAPDIAVRSIYDTEEFTLDVEIGNILDQIIWMNRLDGYEFNYYRTVDISFDWKFSDDLKLVSELGKEKLSVGVEWHGLHAAISTKLDRGYLGIDASYEW